MSLCYFGGGTEKKQKLEETGWTLFFSRLQYGLYSITSSSSSATPSHPHISLFTQPTRWTKLQASFNQLPYIPPPNTHTSLSRVREEGGVSMGTTHNDVRPIYMHCPIAPSLSLCSSQSQHPYDRSSSFISERGWFITVELYSNIAERNSAIYIGYFYHDVTAFSFVTECKLRDVIGAWHRNMSILSQTGAAGGTKKTMYCTKSVSNSKPFSL